MQIDVYGATILKLVPECQFTSFGIDNHCDLLAKDITVTNQYVDYKVKLGDRNERVKVLFLVDLVYIIH